MRVRAIQIESVGGPEVMKLVDIPLDEPGLGEVIVRHHACGINFIGPVPPVALGVLAQKGSLYVTRPSLPAFTSSHEATQAMADDLFAVVSDGSVTIDVARRYPLADAARAHADLEARTTTGSGILVP